MRLSDTHALSAGCEATQDTCRRPGGRVLLAYIDTVGRLQLTKAGLDLSLISAHISEVEAMQAYSLRQSLATRIFQTSGGQLELRDGLLENLIPSEHWHSPLRADLRTLHKLNRKKAPGGFPARPALDFFS